MEKGIHLAYLGPLGSGKTANVRFLSTLLLPSRMNVLCKKERFNPSIECLSFLFESCPIFVYTLPGSILQRSERMQLLAKMQGVVFVFDSALERQCANRMLWWELEAFRQEQKPMFLQYNKRDLTHNLIPIDQLHKQFNPDNKWPWRVAQAKDGVGVVEPLLELYKNIRGFV